MQASHPPASLWRTIKAVAWSLVGLRGRKGYDEDIRNVQPLHLVAVALVALFLFVGGLMAVVHWMVG